MQDMTTGSISRHLVRYALPMVLGNLMQLTYNAADSVIVGKCLGQDALAAVSTANPIMTLMVLGASGIGIGASVIMSRLYGAKQMEALKREFATTLIFSTFFSLAVFAAGFTLAGQLLALTNTPADILPTAAGYLRIVFVGFLFTFQYNILSHAMRGIGDSKTPVLFLGLSCGLNIGLDLLFVAALNLGVAGVGTATALSQAVSALLCLWWISRRVPALHLTAKDLRIDRELLAQTVKSGALTALQQAAQPVGKVMIQSVINAHGTVAIGAFNAVCRVDDFACIPAQSIGSGIMTCTAQNRGARKADRVAATLTRGMGVALCWFPIICSVTLLFRGPLMALLCPDSSRDMMQMGMEYLAIKAWLFVLPCATNALQGYFRGMGHMSIVLCATVMQISIRALCVWLWVPVMGISGEAWGCLAGWTCMLVFETILLQVMRRRGTL